MIRAVIFDCFGVLYIDVSKAYFARFPKHQAALYELDRRTDLGFVDQETYITTVAAITGVTREETAREFVKEHTINQSLIDTIQMLKPHYKIGLLSNIGRGWIEDFFDKHQLHDLFDAVVMSSEEGITKPDPRIFTYTAERLSSAPQECLMIDDRQDNCDGARQAGMESVLYEPSMTGKTIVDHIARLNRRKGSPTHARTA